MQLYTQDAHFQNVKSIQEFTSLIWTKRYSAAGDFSLVVPATADNVDLLAIDTRLGLDDDEETMLIDTQSINNNLLTVSGKTLINFFGNRAAKVVRALGNTGLTVHYPPSVAIVSLVELMTSLVDTNHDGTVDTYVGTGLGLQPNDQMSFMTCVNLDPDTTAQDINVANGDLYSLISNLATNFSKGIKLIATNRTLYGYSLVFTVYMGQDRTSDQTDRQMVRFSPGNKSFVNTTELISNQNYKNVCYTYASSIPATITITDPSTGDTSDHAFNPAMGTGYLPGADVAHDFDRRVILIDDTNFSMDNYATEMSDGSSIATIEGLVNLALDISAYNYLLNYTYTKNVDGEVVPQSPYKYGVDYFLGDVIELQGASGLIQNARITEYIRSQDATGEKAYPTVAVVD